MKTDYTIPALHSLQFWCRPPKGRGAKSSLPKWELAKFRYELRGGNSPPFQDPPVEWRVGSVLNRLTFLMCGSGRFRYLSPAGEVLRRGRVLGFAYPSPASHPSDLGPITSPIWAFVFHKLWSNNSPGLNGSL